jgi:Sigma-54 interaction domain
MPILEPAASSAVTPAAIRGIRGTQSRAAFARTVGVTAQTVYRWELPAERSESRTPRGAELHRLEELLRGDRSGDHVAVARSRTSEPPPPSPVDDDLTTVLPALGRLLEGDARRGHEELVQLLALRRDLSPNARAAGCFGVALYELIFRSDARAAILALAPALRDAEADRLNADTAAKVFSAASLVHAWPDAVLFDLGRVHAFGARVEALAPSTDREAACTACLAALGAAVLVGDQELLDRAYTRLEETRWHGLPPILALHVDEFRMMKLTITGRAAASRQTHEAVIEQAERIGVPLVMGRSLGRLALALLDGLADPAQALELVRRADAVIDGQRAAAGWHQPLLRRVEIEALLRLGRTSEALAAAATLDAWSAESGLPPLLAISALTRLYQVSEQPEALATMAARLRALEVPSLRPIAHAYAAYVESIALYVRSEDPRATVLAFDAAEQAGARWPLLHRDVLMFRVMALIIAGDHAGARIALRRAQRSVDALPSGWLTAHLRRMEGALFVASGFWNDGRKLLESAAATFELGRDACDAVLTRYVLATLRGACDTPDEAELERARADMEAIGVAPPRALHVALEHRVQRAPAAPSSPFNVPPLPRGHGDLVVPLQRLAVRGAHPELILRELRSVLRGLFPEREVRLEEIEASPPAPGAPTEWSEFSDGAGRLFRAGVVGELEPDERGVLSVLTTVAALALEAATLRGVSELDEQHEGEQRPEIPDFVAASPRMRKLRAELVAIASSPATVIVTGESGSGKEVVARAIHALSERAQKPFVAFNCAAVPRDLFEGQLFGYRRGAFTGAQTDHPGVIRAAAGGTLFLDEIGELPLDTQPKLLRLLENSEVFPLGEQRPVRVDVRVVAATHRDLALLVREHQLREDLYYRLQVLPVSVPPLRERREDIPVLARHFVRTLARRADPPVLAPDAISALLAERWPGNVRELRNVIERTLALAGDLPVLRARDLRLSGG